MTCNEETIQEINILLLGKTGVGKSTFINAFVNYLAFDKLEEALTGKLISCIPTRFTITTDDYEEKVIQFGDCQNESQVSGKSVTQCTKSYEISVNDVKIRLIDTPGMCDRRGIDQDNKNFDELLQYLEKFKDLHAICVLLKPNTGHITILFEYHIKQLFSRLEKSASDNIIFLFTHCRGAFYRPGDALPTLRKIRDEIHSRPPYVSVPFGKNNIFCIDNEAFRYLLAVRDGIKFSREETRDFENSWSTSSLERLRMIMYIARDEIDCLKPHPLQNTISVNKARRLIINLAKPIADVTEIIHNLKGKPYKLIEEYEKEREFVVKLSVELTHFLQKSAMIPYNDSYQRYIQYLIANEEFLGVGADQSRMHSLKRMLLRYEEEKCILDKNLKAAQRFHNSVKCAVTSKNLLDWVQKLYRLPNIGETIKKLSESKLQDDSEYIHSIPIKSKAKIGTALKEVISLLTTEENYLKLVKTKQEDVKEFEKSTTLPKSEIFGLQKQIVEMQTQYDELRRENQQFLAQLTIITDEHRKDKENSESRITDLKEKLRNQEEEANKKIAKLKQKVQATENKVKSIVDTVASAKTKIKQSLNTYSQRESDKLSTKIQQHTRITTSDKIKKVAQTNRMDAATAKIEVLNDTEHKEQTTEETAFIKKLSGIKVRLNVQKLPIQNL